MKESTMEPHPQSTHSRETETDRDGWSPQGPVTELTEEHAWAELATRSFGRLALSVDDQPQIFPVNFAVSDRTLVFRTAAGAKLRELLHNQRVAFEADRLEHGEAWSVVLRGTAEVIVDEAEVAAADRLELPYWVPTLEYSYVRIVPTDIRGRHFIHRLHAERQA
jgi:nitroimidazol reductase NimA-like FMN-containing flavoprotein (pyridoxamine 5'-phosphate oxidase superfamily)